MGRLQRIKSTDGYTIPVAIVIMILLMAFAAGILLVAYYDFMNSSVRHQQNQTYLYAKNIVEENTKSIEQGKFNKFLCQTVDGIHDDMITNLTNPSDDYPQQYAKQYSFTLDLGTENSTIEPTPITNDLNKEQILLVMNVEYIPQGVGQLLPEAVPDYLQVGDRLKIEYIVTKTDSKGGQEMSYFFKADYVCSKDQNKKADGTTVDQADKKPDYENILWTLNTYTGNIYTK